MTSAPSRPSATLASRDFVGRPRLVPGEGFAVRGGLWRWALRVACERAADPVGIGVRGGPVLTSHFHELGSGRLHVRVSAKGCRAGLPVILVHGVIVSGRYLLPMAVELAADMSVSVPDLPGYGLSDAPDGRLDMATLADAVVACARAEGHQRVALVANSFGAQIAVEAALRRPDVVDRMVLLGPTVDPAARSVIRQCLRWVRNAPDEHLSALPMMARDLVDLGLVWAALMLRTMCDDPIAAKLPHVRCPVLVVRAGRDRVVPQRWADELTGCLPRGELVLLPGYAHMAHYSGPLALAPLLRPFLLEPSEPSEPPEAAAAR